MVAKNSSHDWLPPGWKIQIKVKDHRKIKCYVHPKTSQKLYSKSAVLRQVKNESISDDKSQATVVHPKRSSTKEDMQLVVANDCYQLREGKKAEERENLEDYSKVAKNSPEWLPSGWKVLIKVKSGRKIKCYVHPNTCQKFYSKPEVLRHLKNESKSDDKSEATEVQAKKSSGKENMQLVVANDYYQWLPTGWTVEIRSRKSGLTKGTEYKCYIEPASGSTFYSKPEVLRYLKSVEGSEGSSGGKERRSTRHSSDNRSVDLLTAHKSIVEPSGPQISKKFAPENLSSGRKEVIVENTVDEDLPSGWIKELRKRVLGNQVDKLDPLYVHPASGLVFRSKQEVLRYLESGEISRHAYRRRNGSLAGGEPAVDKLSPPSTVLSDKSTSCGSREERTSREDLVLVPEAGVRRITRSLMKSIAASGGAYNPVQRFLLPEKANRSNNQEVLPLRLESPTNDASLTKDVSQEIQNGDDKKSNASMIETKSPSGDILKVKNPDAVAIRGCSNGKPQTSKRKMKDQKPSSVTSRSSKRLAGIDAQVIFHSSPLERTLRAASRKSIGGISISSAGLSSNSIQEKPGSPDLNKHYVPADQEGMHRPLNVDTHHVLVTEEQRSNSDNLMQKVLPTVDLEEDRPPGFPKSLVTEAQTFNTAQPSEEPRDRKQESDIGQKQLPRDRPIREGQPVTRPGGTREQTATCQPIQEVQPARVGREVKQPAFESTSPSQSTILNLPKDPPPPFLGGRPDAVLESRIEQSNTGTGTVLLQASTGRDTEPPASEFSFPSPMWSDPCLEFAFKTLTGVIPLDDNLAIEDYIQHQLRTSQQSNDFQNLPDVDAPSFFQRDETKSDSSRPEGVRFPTGSSLSPHKTIR